jgi:hypothetical protein
MTLSASVAAMAARPVSASLTKRGEHDADPVRGDNFHEAAKELTPRKGAQARDRLVEDEALGRFAIARVRASCARWPPERVPARWRRSRPSCLILLSASVSQPGLSHSPIRRC